MALTHPPFLLLLTIAMLLLLATAPPSLEQRLDAADLIALLAIKNSLSDIRSTHFFSTWNFSSPDPCSSFSGITCFRSRVATLKLGTPLSDSPMLSGHLSPAISSLTQLTQLILFPGIVSGSIPPQLGQLKNLRVISLTNNLLSGPIPSSLSSLPSLHTLDLSYNRLTGSIPPGLMELPDLKVLILSSNRLSGELPSVSALLLHLDLKGNEISGQLPSLPSSLRYLSVADNAMWGPINGTQSLSQLVYLDLSMNLFTGTIPTSLFNPRLSSMLLQRNNLSGGIPSSIVDPTGDDSTSYGQGSVVDLSHNFLTGELSRVLAGVESLFLNNNLLMGTVPEEYVRSLYQGSTKTLYLQHNYISGFPLEAGSALPVTASLCLCYNCMVPPVGLTACPASAGGQLSRPASQCFANKKEHS